MHTWRASAAVAAAAGIFTLGLVAARPAFATTGTFTGGPVTATPNSAASDASYSIGFTAGNPLPAGGTITFVAPVGTDFTGCASSCASFYAVSVDNGHDASVGSADVSQANGSATDNQVVLTLASSTIDGTDTVTVTTHQTTNPQGASTNESISELTSAESASVPSQSYAIAASEPATMTEKAGGTQSSPEQAQVQTKFSPDLEVQVKDTYNNPVPDATVTFAAPTSGASGVFRISTAGDCPHNGAAGAPNTECIVSTDSGGDATASAFTANSTAGTYSVTARVSTATGQASVSLPMQNTAAKPTTITGGLVTVSNSTVAASPTTYTIDLTTNDPVPSGGTLTFLTPNGTTLPSPTCLPVGCSPTDYTVTYGSGTAVNVTNIATSNAQAPQGTLSSSSKNKVIITVGTAIPATTAVTVQVLNVANTPLANEAYVILESDSADSTPVSSGTFTIYPGPATQLVAQPSDYPDPTQVGTTFDKPMLVTAEDNSGNPVWQGTPVTFVLSDPAGAPGGTFPGSITQQTNYTNAAGQATSSNIKADTVSGAWTATVELNGGASPIVIPLTNDPGPVSQLVSPTGGGQTATVHSKFPNPLTIVAEDQYTNHVPGAPLTFTALASGATATFALCPGSGSTAQSCVVATDDNGVATSSAFTASTTSGQYTIQAASGPVATPFIETNSPGPAKQMVIVSGDNENAKINTAFPDPLVTKVQDTYGNGVPGEQVTFAASSSSGPSGTFATCAGPGSTTTQCVVVTESSGYATSSTYTANGTVGTDTVTATDNTTTSLTSQQFTLHNLVGAPATLTVNSGDGQAVPAGTAYAPLSVTVKDSMGNLVAGASITFTISGDANFAGSSTTMVNTDSNGVATTTTPLTAGHSTGSVTVTAAPTGQSSPFAPFSLTNEPGTNQTASVSPASANQVAQVGHAFAQPVVISIVDQYGNPVPNVPVTFNLPTGGPTATFPGGQPVFSMQTNGSGQATSPAMTANDQSGQWHLTFTAGQPGHTVSGPVFETNSAGPSTQFVAVSGGGQSSHVGRPFGSPLQVKVTDSFGNPVPNQTVTFTLPIGGATATLSGKYYSETITTDANGIATSLPLTAGLRPGSYEATASTVVNGATHTVQFGLKNTEGYWLVGSDGSVQAFGDAPNFGSTAGVKLDKPIVGMAALPDGSGYWLAASDGGIFSFGHARFHGSTGGIALNKPIVAIAATPDGGGYWLVASDGGIFAFGDARFHGSTGNVKLVQPIVGMAATPDGGGYWLVASDGGMFAFGDAKFYGSMGGQRLNKPIVGMVPAPGGNGYWLVASDGGIFAFGPGARFFGSTGNVNLVQPILGMTATASGQGYWFVAHDGGVFAFGPDAKFEGSGSGTGEPIVGMAQG
jgi:hypothetical protein